MQKQRKGFRIMRKKKRKAVQSLGGKNAVKRHRWTSEEAKKASKKGLEIRWRKV